MKILYIEDDPDSERLAALFLRTGGHRLIGAKDARQGLKLAYREAPDVIMIDYHLPTVNGQQAVDLLKTTGRLKDTPILAVTASVNQSDIQNFMKSGCDGFIPKPFNREHLLAEIERVVAERRLART
jgi:CheY-like chemotaxis protein